MADENVNENLETKSEVNNENDGKVFSFEDIEKARADEKKKLYPQIEKLKAEVTKLNEKLSDKLLNASDKDNAIKEKDEKIAELEAKVTKLEEKGAEAKVSDKLVKELQTKLDEAVNALAEKDKELANIKLASYKADKTKDLDESVLDLVTGTTQEEIDASVEKAKAIFEKISAKFADNSKKEEEKKTNVNTLPKVNYEILNENTFKDVKPEDIMKIDVKTAEGRKQYAEMRKKLGL